MLLSNFGRKFSTDPVVAELMDDLGNALAKGDHVAMLGGGNPAHIQGMQQLFEKETKRLLAHPDEFRAALGNYDPPQGNPGFIEAIVGLLRKLYGWDITPANVVVSSGSQLGLFTLFNILAGAGDYGPRKILFPLVPEYMGYVDQGLDQDFFTARQPLLELRGEHEFKYGINFESLDLEGIAAMCISRPTNPSGNVVTNDELARLAKLAASRDIPVIVDNAYGLPFPGVITPEAKPLWNDSIVNCMSLSKLGLPSARVGIIVARPELAAAVAKAGVVLSLASPTFGQALVRSAITDGSLMQAVEHHLQPYYAEAAAYARPALEDALAGTPYRLHSYEGSYFFWLWLPDLPIRSKELYRRLKARGVLVVPGEYFFPGLSDTNWEHQYQCLRLNFARPKHEIGAGFKILGEEVRRAYR